MLLCVPDYGDRRCGAAALAADGAAPRFAGHTSGASTLASLAPLADAGAVDVLDPPAPDRPGPTRRTSQPVPAAIAGSGPGGARVRPGARRAPGACARSRSPSRRGPRLPRRRLHRLELPRDAGRSRRALLLRGRPERGTPASCSRRSSCAPRRTGRSAAGEALTGPIARGDEDTVARHLDALRETRPEPRRRCLRGARGAHPRGSPRRGRRMRVERTTAGLRLDAPRRRAGGRAHDRARRRRWVPCTAAIWRSSRLRGNAATSS